VPDYFKKHPKFGKSKFGTAKFQLGGNTLPEQDPAVFVDHILVPDVE
jgi:hypothetical protein